MEGIYITVLVAHILAAILGFGIYLTSSMTHAKALKGRAGDAVTLFENSLSVTKVGTYAIMTTLVLGVILISLSGAEGSGVEKISWGAPWVSASFVVWFLMLGVTGGLVTKNLKDASARVAELKPGSTVADDTAVVSALQKVGLGDALLQLLLVTMLVLMIWQPGG